MSKKIYTEVHPDEIDPIPAKTHIRATLGDVQVEGKLRYSLSAFPARGVTLTTPEGFVLVCTDEIPIKVEVITEHETAKERFMEAPIGTVVTRKENGATIVKVSDGHYYSQSYARAYPMEMLVDGPTPDQYTWAYPQEEEA